MLKGSLLIALLAASALAADKYTGPRPPKKDVLYLVHADNLVETENGAASEEKKKDDILNVISGTTSPVRTPLAEPVFIIETNSITPESLELYKLEVKNGHREILIPQKKRRNGPRALRLQVTRLDRGLYRIEASETLENGQYAVSPSGSSRVFCFEVY
jgi:hypothetical protein